MINGCVKNLKKAKLSEIGDHSETKIQQYYMKITDSVWSNFWGRK
jgi:hypothetical protein